MDGIENRKQIVEVDIQNKKIYLDEIRFFKLFLVLLYAASISCVLQWTDSLRTKFIFSKFNKRGV